MSSPAQIQVLAADRGPSVELLEEDGSAVAIVWPEMGATLRSLHAISLPSGARTLKLCHPGEAVYYVIRGAGQALDVGDGNAQTLIAGSMIHVEPGTPYVLSAGADGMSLVGGPAPPDPALYR